MINSPGMSHRIISNHPSFLSGHLRSASCLLCHGTWSLQVYWSTTVATVAAAVATLALERRPLTWSRVTLEKSQTRTVQIWKDSHNICSNSMSIPWYQTRHSVGLSWHIGDRIVGSSMHITQFPVKTWPTNPKSHFPRNDISSRGRTTWYNLILDTTTTLLIVVFFEWNTQHLENHSHQNKQLLSIPINGLVVFQWFQWNHGKCWITGVQPAATSWWREPSDRLHRLPQEAQRHGRYGSQGGGFHKWGYPTMDGL